MVYVVVKFGKKKLYLLVDFEGMAEQVFNLSRRFLPDFGDAEL